MSKYPPLAIYVKEVRMYLADRRRFAVYPHNRADFNLYYKIHAESTWNARLGATCFFLRDHRPDPGSIIVVRLVDFGEKIWELAN